VTRARYSRCTPRDEPRRRDAELLDEHGLPGSAASVGELEGDGRAAGALAGVEIEIMPSTPGSFSRSRRARWVA
jgi:hypothetical protein